MARTLHVGSKRDLPVAVSPGDRSTATASLTTSAVRIFAGSSAAGRPRPRSPSRAGEGPHPVSEPSLVVTAHMTVPRAGESSNDIDIQGRRRRRRRPCRPPPHPQVGRDLPRGGLRGRRRGIRWDRPRPSPRATTAAASPNGTSRRSGSDGAASNAVRRRPSARKGAPRNPPEAPLRGPPARRCEPPGTAARARRRNAGRTPRAPGPVPGRRPVSTPSGCARSSACCGQPRSLMSSLISCPPLHVRLRPATG